ncbi:MAG TPA: protein kinase [Polyangiaceae bacterium]
MPDAAYCHQLEPGDLLRGKYRVERLLGEGGFGRVYAAHNIDIDIPVAIKVRRIPGPDRLLRREAQAGARLSNPHSVRVYDIERLDDGTPFIVMELLPGRSLSAHLRTHGPVAPTLATRWALELCSALEEAHALHLVHRDIKPSNLFLVERLGAPAQLKLLDFGLTKALSEAGDDTVTERGIVVGSPAYMSPEQVRGARVTAQSDVWSTGVVLYEMLTGKRPFEAPTSAAILAAIAADAPTPLAEVAPHIPSAFDAVVNRCLRKRASERYTSVAELADDLSKRVAAAAPGDQLSSTSVSATATLSISDRPSADSATRTPLWAALALVVTGATFASALAYDSIGTAHETPEALPRGVARSSPAPQRSHAPTSHAPTSHAPASHAPAPTQPGQSSNAPSSPTPIAAPSAAKPLRPTLRSAALTGPTPPGTRTPEAARPEPASVAADPVANGESTPPPSQAARVLFRDPDF